MSSLNAPAPLFWGHGPKTLEVFLEPTCPFSVRAFLKFDELLQQAGEDNLTIKIRLQSQPWHMFSGVIVQAILAASMLPQGREAAKNVMLAIADHREEFEFEEHCRGENLDCTPRQLIEKLEKYSGVALFEAFDAPQLTQEVKWHSKYSRQNGIHVSPTFMIDGLVIADMGSGETVESWLGRLFPSK